MTDESTPEGEQRPEGATTPEGGADDRNEGERKPKFGEPGQINELHGDVSGEREIQIRQREAEMVRMRAAMVPLRVIAEHYDISESRVSHIVHAAMRRSIARPARDLQAELVAQMDELIAANARTALGLPRSEGEKKPTVTEQVRAFEACGRAVTQKGRWLGMETINLNVRDERTPEQKAEALAEQVRAYQIGLADAAEQPALPNGQGATNGDSA